MEENLLPLEEMYAIIKKKKSFMLKGLLEFMSLVIPFNSRKKRERNRHGNQEQAEDTLAGCLPSSDVISFNFKPLSKTITKCNNNSSPL